MPALRAHDVDDRADRLGASRRQGRRGRAGRDAARLRRSAAGLRRHRAVFDSHLQSDHRRQLDLSAAGGGRQRSLRLHRQERRRQADGDRAAVRGVPSHREAVLRDAGRRHFPFLFSGAGPRAAGPVHSRRRLAQPRLRRVRRGRHGRRLDDARVRVVDGLHLLHDGEGAPRHVPRQAQPLGHRQGHRPRAAAPLGREAVAGHVGGARRRRQAVADRVSQHHRQHDGGGRGAERHLRAGRDHLRVVSREGHHRAAVSAVRVRRRCAIRDRRRVRSRRRHADDRQAVQPRQCVSRPKTSRASASSSTRR